MSLLLQDHLFTNSFKNPYKTTRDIHFDSKELYPVCYIRSPNLAGGFIWDYFLYFGINSQVIPTNQDA